MKEHTTASPPVHIKEICSECGDDAPREVRVFARSFGQPWLWDVTCEACDRIVIGKNEAEAVEKWNAGQTDYYVVPDDEAEQP